MALQFGQRKTPVLAACLHSFVMSAENTQDSAKRDSVSSADYDPVLDEAIKVNANQRKQLSSSEKKAQQSRFAKGAQELDNAVKRAVDKGVNIPADKKGNASNNSK